jgi:hypothetical protein
VKRKSDNRAAQSTNVVDLAKKRGAPLLSISAGATTFVKLLTLRPRSPELPSAERLAFLARKAERRRAAAARKAAKERT